MRANLVVAVWLVVAAVTGVTLAAAPVTAQADESVLEDVLEGDDTTETLTTAAKAIWASRERATFWVQERIPSFLTEAFPSLAPDRQTAEDEIASVATFYNDHNATLEAYVNDRANVSENKTIKISLHLRGDTANRYLEVNATDGNVTTSEVVSSTDRKITDRVVVCGYAADQALEELQRFHDDFAEPNKDVNRDYLAELAGKYGKDVETTLISSAGECGRSS